MSKELTVRIRMPENFTPKNAAEFVRGALNSAWNAAYEPCPRWNISVYQTFDFDTHSEHRKVHGKD
jgi:hypothetical protein